MNFTPAQVLAKAHTLDRQDVAHVAYFVLHERSPGPDGTVPPTLLVALWLFAYLRDHGYGFTRFGDELVALTALRQSIRVTADALAARRLPDTHELRFTDGQYVSGPGTHAVFNLETCQVDSPPEDPVSWRCVNLAALCRKRLAELTEPS